MTDHETQSFNEVPATDDPRVDVPAEPGESAEERDVRLYGEKAEPTPGAVVASPEPAAFDN